MEKTTFGQRLKLAFGNAKNAEIARKIGVGETAVSNYLSGRVPDAEKLVAIRNSTNCDLNWLLTGEGSTERDCIEIHDDLLGKLQTIAKEQAQEVFADAEIAGGNLETRSLELVVGYLLNRALHSVKLLPESKWLMTAEDRRRINRLTFVRDLQPSIEEQIRELVRTSAPVGEADEFRDIIRDIVKEEVSRSRKRPVYPLHVADDEEEETTRRKAG